MRRPLIPCIVLFVSFSAIAKETAQPVAEWIREIRERAANLEDTKYQHKTEIELSHETYYCDCSGYVGFFIKRSFPNSYSSLAGKEASWRKRPLAVTFHETFIRAGKEPVTGWSRIQNLAKARAGDILAWRKDEVVQGESTGHVVFIVESPSLEADGRYRVRVLDSTRSIHADDSRAPDGNGVGEGTMWFRVNDGGEPIAYFVDERERPGKSTQIAIGRIVP